MKFMETVNFPAVKIYANGARVMEMAYTTPDMLNRKFERVKTKSLKTFAEKVQNYIAGYLTGAPHDRQTRDLIANAWHTFAFHLANAAWHGKALDLYKITQLPTWGDGTKVIAVHLQYYPASGAMVSFHGLEELAGLSIYPEDHPDEDGLMNAADKLGATFRGRAFLTSLYDGFSRFEDDYKQFVPYLRAYGASAI